MKQRIQGIIIGILIIAMSLTVGAAIGNQNIEATYRDIKLVVDGEQITPKDANGNIVEPFIYNGTTYLPVRAVGEALGKTVDWDGATSTVYIGLRPGSVQYMFDVVPTYQSHWFFEYSNLKDPTKSFTMAGQKYTNGCQMGNEGYALYNLNGQYKKIKGKIGHWDGGGTSNGTLYIYTDGKLYKEIELKADMIPTDISIDVTGVLQLKLELKGAVGSQYAFANVIIE